MTYNHGSFPNSNFIMSTEAKIESIVESKTKYKPSGWYQVYSDELKSIERNSSEKNEKIKNLTGSRSLFHIQFYNFIFQRLRDTGRTSDRIYCIHRS